MRRRTPLAPIAILAIFLLALAGPSIAATTIPIYLPLLSAPPAPTPTPTPTVTPVPYAGPDVRVAEWCSDFLAAGSDESDPTHEHVCVQNHDTIAADLSNWSIQDLIGHTYTFPEFALNPGMHMRIHTGSGANTATDLYWGRGNAVWNNTGDTVYLYDDAGSLVDVYTY